MRKLALVHKAWFAATAVTDRWRLLFEAIRDECGYDIAFIEDACIAPAGVDVVLFACSAGHFDEKSVRMLYASCAASKRIVYLADFQPKRQPFAIGALARADVILAPEGELYRRIFPDKRVEFFPYFFAPQERYTELPWNASPKMRCLVSGPLRSRNYPLRAAAARSPLAKVLPHPGSHGALQKGAVVRDRYARTLNEYFCAVAGGLRGGVTTKTFEIMAAGSLLLTEPLADVAEAGLDPGVHYVAATPRTVTGVIAEVLAHPEDYERIRRHGCDVAQVCHGIRSRVEQFARIEESL